jgi:hypothetical protein
MTFSLESLHQSEKAIMECFDSVLKTTNCKNIKDFTEISLAKPNISKSVLANIISDLVRTLEKSQTVLRSAAVLTEEFKSNHIES